MLILLLTVETGGWVVMICVVSPVVEVEGDAVPVKSIFVGLMTLNA